MERDRFLGAIGLAGLAFGLFVVIAGRLGGEVERLMSAYGSLVILSAAYLLVGLTVRRLLARRGQPSRGPVAIVTERRV
ncbi:MAG: hypothetical protein E6J50_02560 [Chloroflexi bacterium]|nr:MAG: hypothetical protein E6J50_02560 [Chloroflexota bacterium]